MEIVNLKLSDIHPYHNNPRINDQAVDAVAESIRQCTYVAPIIVDENHVILAGHTRYKALKKLGHEEAEVIVKSGLTDEQKRKYRLLDNKTAELAEWDFDQLETELDGLDFDGFDFGFGLPEEEAEIVEDEPPEIDEDADPKAKRGDIYQLGRHRLICGDSTDAEDVAHLMDGEKADMVFTDPPYGVSIVKNRSVGGSGATHFGGVGGNNIVKTNDYSPIIGDDTTETAKKAYEIFSAISDNQIIFGGNYFTDFLHPHSCWLVWDKENTGNFADVELAWTSMDKGAKLYRWLWNGLSRKGDRKSEGVKRVHPTQKPVGLIAEIFIAGLYG